LKRRRNDSAIQRPRTFGRNPTAAVVEVKKGEPALFFSAASGGVSGFTIHFALLRPAGKALKNLLTSDASVSAQSQNAFWTDPSASDAPFLVTADYILGPDESHFGPHRFVISAYEGDYYFLQDRYRTVRSYDQQARTFSLQRKRRSSIDSSESN
jgi:hypothetical protein